MRWSIVYKPKSKNIRNIPIFKAGVDSCDGRFIMVIIEFGK